MISKWVSKKHKSCILEVEKHFDINFNYQKQKRSNLDYV